MARGGFDQRGAQILLDFHAVTHQACWIEAQLDLLFEVTISTHFPYYIKYGWK